MEIRYLSVQEAIAINVAVIQIYSPGEHIGVKDSGLLESAVTRPKSSVFGEDAYPSLFEKAAGDLTVDMVNHRYALQELVTIIREHCQT